MPALVERSTELDALSDAIGRAVEGSGAVVVLEAAAGLGKTALLDQAAELAGERGCRVSRSTPAALERHFPYGSIRTLFERPVRELERSEREQRLEGAAGHACSMLLGGRAPGADAAPMMAYGILWLASLLAERAPLALVVDDAQWADRPSLEVLAYLARRVEEIPLVILVGARTSEPEAPSDLLSLIGSAPATSVLRPRPLTTPGAFDLMRRLAPDVSIEVCHRCRQAADGNPWLLLELARQIASRGPGVLDEGAGEWPVSEVALRVVRGRLAELAPRERAVGRALAVLGDGAAPHLVAQMAGIALVDVAPARDALTGAGLLAEGELRFPHALVAAALIRDLAPTERARLHGEAARVLLADGEPTDLIAGHLLQSDPRGDSAVSALLRCAADEAAERGAPHTAAAYLERALQERAEGDERGRMLARLATMSFDAGQPDSGKRLREALREVRDPEARIDVLSRLAALEVFQHHGGLPLALFEGLEIGADEHDARLAIEAAALDALLMLPERHEERSRRAAAVTVRDDADPRLANVVLAHRAWLASEQGIPGAEECARLAAASLRDGSLLESSGVRSGFHLSARALIRCDRFDEAREAVSRLRDLSMRRGSMRLRAAAEWCDAEIALRLGQVALAENHARTTLDLMEDTNLVSGGAVEVLVCALAERGAFDQARELLRARGYSGELGYHYWEIGIRHARSRLWLAEGDYERAYTEAREAGRLREEQGRPNPTWTAWRSTAALALAHAGRLEEAIALADAELALAERFGAWIPVATALHARCVAEPESDRRTELAQRGLGLLPVRCRAGVGVGLQLELGRTLSSSGQRLEAREPLRRALADADALGLTLIAQAARRELVRTGLRPRNAAIEGVASLTPRQRQVCELAARGRSNRGIAQELFLSVKTVETHLAAGYRKLGVAGRDELATALAV